MKLFPATQTQSYICGLVSDPSNPASRLFNIALAVRVKPSVDQRRLTRAFDTIQARHDVFRTAFVQTGKAWHVTLHEKPRASVRIHDHAPVPPDEQRQLLIPHLNPQRDLEKDPLISMDLFRFGAEGDVVLVQVSHTISDGYGFLVALDEFANLLLNRPLASAPPSFEAYLNQTRHITKPQAEARKAYWTELLTRPPPPPDFGWTAGGRPPPTDTIARDCQPTVFSLTPEQSNTLAEMVQTDGTTVFARMAASFFLSMHQISGSDDLLFYSNLGRLDAKLTTFAGLHTVLLPMRCSTALGKTMGPLSAAMRQQVTDSIAHMPFDPVGPDGPIMTDIARAGGYMRQFRLHLERSESRQGQSLFFELLKHGKPMKLFGAFEFQGVPLTAPTQSLSDLSIIEGKTDDALTFKFVRDIAVISQSDADDLAALFCENLLRQD